MNTKNVIIAIIVLAVILIGGYFLLSNNTTQAPTVEQNNTTSANAPKTYEVVYSDAGYSPAELTIKAGDTVVFKNQSSGQMWTASAMHPVHMAYTGTSLQQHCPDPENNDFDQCSSSGSGSEWPFTFTKTGTFGYHNHVVANEFGKIIVQ